MKIYVPLQVTSMNGAYLHIKNLQRALFLLAIAIALTPCSIKETVFSSFDIAFERPLNKTRTLQSANTECELQVLSHSYIKDNTQSAANQVPNAANTASIILAGCKKVALKQYAKKSTGNSPPMYILYKRLKFDIA
ncbi:hypothetical protein [Arenibacter certesii]|uniref:Uncharacterized protein n=1 Tax=Arenibacter certesii TaxID=228955 RepID=A0A918IVZ0_9FLAO|nr:hypothetical protein [Arenibacter certesii]GGW34681.1 hypothetical protein GCM10007383_19670 [Arenibacter certesii]